MFHHAFMRCPCSQFSDVRGNIMQHFRDIDKLAIFSVGKFLFGVDTNQIQEILSIKHPVLLTGIDENCPFIVLRHNRKPLPVFDLRQHFNLSEEPFKTRMFPPSITVVTCYRAGLLFACRVATVEDIFSVSFRSLRPVPPLLTNIAQKSCLWGFYDVSGMLVPLVDIEESIAIQHVESYKNLLPHITTRPPHSEEK